MGMTDDMRGVLDAYLEMKESLDSMKSNMRGFYKSVMGYGRLSSENEVADLLKKSYNEIKPVLKKYGLEIEDDERMNDWFINMGRQAISLIPISGVLCIAEAKMVYDLHEGGLSTNLSHIFLLTINNNEFLKYNKISDEFINEAKDAFGMAEYARVMTKWLTPHNLPSFVNLESSIEWVEEVIRRRNMPPMGQLIEYYAIAKNMLKYLMETYNIDLRVNTPTIINTPGKSETTPEPASSPIAPSNSSVAMPVAESNPINNNIGNYVASTAQPPKYEIQITTDNKTQTITTLNDPADFLAALTGL